MTVITVTILKYIYLEQTVMSKNMFVVLVEKDVHNIIKFLTSASLSGSQKSAGDYSSCTQVKAGYTQEEDPSSSQGSVWAFGGSIPCSSIPW